MKQVVDFKIILHQLKRILEQVERSQLGYGWSSLLRPGLANINLFLHKKNQFQSNEENGNRESQLYEERIAELEQEINTKNQRIKRLEESLSSKRGRQTMRQVSSEWENNTRSLTFSGLQCLSVRPWRGHSSPARSPCARSEVLKPCNHVWGPCANDHTNHHARRGRGTPSHQFRSLSATSRLWGVK